MKWAAGWKWKLTVVDLCVVDYSLLPAVRSKGCEAINYENINSNFKFNMNSKMPFNFGPGDQYRRDVHHIHFPAHYFGELSLKLSFVFEVQMHSMKPME
jgi:hypothetical protein